MHTNRVTRVHTHKHAYLQTQCVCVREIEREIHANARAHTQILYGYFAELPESIMVVSHAVSRKNTSVPTPLFTNATETHAAAGASSVGGAVVVFVQPPFGLKQVISDQPPYSMMMLQQKQCVLFDVMSLVTEREREREREKARERERERASEKEEKKKEKERDQEKERPRRQAR